MTAHRLSGCARRTRGHCRGGFTFVDLIAVVFVIALLLAISASALEKARAQAAATGCRENLRKIGLALGAYVQVHGVLPTVTRVGPDMRLAQSPFAMLVPYLPDQPATGFVPARPWWEQGDNVAAATIATYRCPAALHDDPIDSNAARKLSKPAGRVLGVTDYIVSKGPVDSWCLEESGISAVARRLRGAFEIGRPLRLDQIDDGAANTMAIGEGTGGPNWPMAALERSPIPQIDRETGEKVTALNFWSWPLINTTANKAKTDLVASSVFGSTQFILNRNPVIETIADLTRLKDCRTSFDHGPDLVSNFRSAHSGGGAFFLFADGSAHFVSSLIDSRTYEWLSTIAGTETVEYVN